MDPITAHDRAQQAFAGALAAVGPDRLGLPTPCTEWTVAELVAHVVAGNTFAATGERVPVEGDPVAAYPASAAAAGAAFRLPEEQRRTVRLSFGEVPPQEYVTMRAVDVLVHTWDLSTATGQPTDLDPELAEHLLSVARRLPQFAPSPDFRGPGKRLGPEQPCRDDRPAADRLAAYFGRQVVEG